MAIKAPIEERWRTVQFLDLVRSNRSIRRFKEEEQLDRETLKELVDLARQAGSSMNLQPLKYLLSFTPETNARIFPLVKWAGYLKDWSGPAEGERPAAYIIIFGDRTLGDAFSHDTGIAAQTILLGAVENGFNGCMLGSFTHEEVREALDVPEHLETQLIIALGVPAEKSVLEEVGETGSIRYWRDEKGVLHVPKRPLEELILS